MAFLQPQTAVRALRSASTARLVSGARLNSSLTKASGGKPLVEQHKQPDYSITPDKATSTYTPTPKRLQDGTESVTPAATISGAPIELQARSVRIYKESKPATQSGNWRSNDWRMDWDILPKGHRWENPLMGWQSSGDVMQGTHMNFRSKEDAIHFAEKQGYEYFVQEPNSRKFKPKAYANNFLYSARELKQIRTK